MRPFITAVCCVLCAIPRFPFPFSPVLPAIRYPLSVRFRSRSEPYRVARIVFQNTRLSVIHSDSGSDSGSDSETGYWPLNCIRYPEVALPADLDPNDTSKSLLADVHAILREFAVCPHK